MKRAASYVLVAALAGLLVYVLMSQDERPVVESEQTSAEDRASGAGDNENTTADVDQPASTLTQPSAPASTRAATVARLADGDSFDITWVDTGDRDEVRMFGINAPEGGVCYGDTARDLLEILIDDQELAVEIVGRDEFGRVLGNVWVNDAFVNLTMVEIGAALALSDGGQHAGLITEAQDLARSSSAGLWDPAACGADPQVQVRIAEIFANAPGPDNENKNGEWIAIENLGAAAVDMTGWSIRDESTRHRFSFPDNHTIAGGDITMVFSGCGNDTAHELFWCDDDPVWNNGGDTGFLVDPDGRFADSLSYSG